MAAVRSSLRKLLKHIDKLPSSKVDNGFKGYVFNQIRNNRDETDPTKVKQFRHQMSEYLRTIEAVKEQKYLRSLDAGDILSDHEKNAIIARKVGFVMPDQHQP
mmetsp:Transcript_14398/g.17116  ORF Transcript_14398/g.17116 Transcript_14398/m.17116 type:complete len:103 (+) Transcript_14398:17-325(+)